MKIANYRSTVAIPVAFAAATVIAAVAIGVHGDGAASTATTSTATVAADELTRAGQARDLHFFRCVAAGGEIERHSDASCPVPLPALEAVAADLESRRAALDLFTMRCRAAGGEVLTNSLRCSVDLPALAAENK